MEQALWNFVNNEPFLINPVTKHRLTLYKAKKGYKVSPYARLTPKTRGKILFGEIGGDTKMAIDRRRRVMRRAVALRRAGLSLREALRKAWREVGLGEVEAWYGEPERHRIAALKGWETRRRRARRFGEIEAWYGDPEGHRRAALLGWKRRRARGLGEGELLIMNPAEGILPIKLEEIPVTVGGGIIGYVGTKYIPAVLLPANWQTGILKIVGQLGSGLALSLVTSKLLKQYELGKYIFIGSLIAVITDQLKGIIPQLGSDLGAIAPTEVTVTPPAYTPEEVSAYIPQMENYAGYTY